MTVKYLNCNSRKIKISNPSKTIFPNTGYSKLDVIKYYEKIAEIILPHMKNRPVVMQRFPDGIEQKGFFQKNISKYFPKWIRTVIVDKENGSVKHVICNDKATLIYLANQACITPHVWLSKKRTLQKPDRLIFDLDPPNNNFKLALFAAKKLHSLLEKLNLESYVMTTGSSGLHVWVPLDSSFDFQTSRAFAKKIAEFLVKNNREKLTVEHRKERRNNRLFIDYLRNSYGQTSVVPYSIRAIEGAPVATPLEWSELNKPRLNSRFYTIKNIFKRLKHKKDPWKNMKYNSTKLENAEKILQVD